MTLGASLAAWAIRIFLLPNQLIDGGVVGISLIVGRLFSEQWISAALVLLNVPFLFMAYRGIRKSLVIYMVIATLIFAGFLQLFKNFEPFYADPTEIIVIGGALLGVGAGLIIRGGGCLDGTEILAILINQRYGFTVGQVVLGCNIFIFGAYGLLFRDWHIALQSLMTYIVAYKMMDIVIVGLDEVKSVLIIASEPRKVAEAILHEMGLGLTVMYGRGGFSGDSKELLYVIVERLQLAELKEVIIKHDPHAFIAIQNIHEVVYGHHALPYIRKRRHGAG
jgi:uncharacterized membrane-anchored protein YitT (DUF2179 family)